MPAQRRLSWSAAVRDLRSDRAVRAPIREERLSCTASAGLIAWRGRSGRRYVAQIHTVLSLPVVAATDVLIAVQRDADTQVASIVAVRHGLDATSFPGWIASMVSGGANEVHVHMLADTAAERDAIVDDLPDADADAGLTPSQSVTVARTVHGIGRQPMSPGYRGAAGYALLPEEAAAASRASA